jgi:dTDP-D-glucose 4,6-dehydratase
VLRPFNAYGERAHQDSDKSEVIYRFIARILQNKRPYIYGNGQNSRDFTYVKDIAEIFFDILKINCLISSDKMKLSELEICMIRSFMDVDEDDNVRYCLLRIHFAHQAHDEALLLL